MLRIYCPLLAVMFIMIVAEAVSQAINDPHQIASGRQSPDSLISVWAEVMDNDTWCRVSWNHDDYFFQIAMDDGTAEDLFVFVNPGGMFAVRFTPTFYPVRVVGGRIYVGDGSFPGPFSGTAFRVILYDDDGEEALPGTALDSIEVMVNNYHWIDFEGLSDTITEGDFFLAMKQLVPAPEAPPIGIDCEIPTYYRSYIKFDDFPWMSAPLQDLMIRAWYTTTLGGTDDSVVYQVDRFSDFDPYGSPLLGDTTHLALTELHFYGDYAWDTIGPGWYAYGVRRYAEGSGWSDYVLSNIVRTPIELISPSCFYQADTGSRPMIVCPPLDSNGVVYYNHIGYNLYRDGSFICYLTPETTSFHPYECEYLTEPGAYTYHITAIFDLEPYGFPGETGESSPISAIYIYSFGFSLPFTEDWLSGNFDENNWEVDGSNWTISGSVGNSPPSAVFNWNPVQTNYSMILESYPLLGNSMNSGEIYLDFDLKLSVFQPTGSEKMHIMVWNWTSQSWHIVKTLSNAEGDIPWTTNKVNITPLAAGEVFKIAFVAEGENSQNIESWHIDNINVCRRFMGLDEKAVDYLHIYPNPSGDLFHIIAPEAIRSLRLYNCTGLPVYSKEIKAKNYVLEVQDYPSGVYLMRLEMKKGTISRKVVINR
ncbi:MAG: T9SS type A sorting domain-containing protein [Bacteroidales bacterium]